MTKTTNNESLDKLTETIEHTEITKAVRKVPKVYTRIMNQIPQHIINNPLLNDAIAKLPSNYNFELYKIVHKIEQLKAKFIALQFPEGLSMFSLTISDIIKRVCSVETVILCDVTYGACCIEDHLVSLLGCDLLIHFGHSCLIPINETLVKTLYIFVEIRIDLNGAYEAITKHIPHLSICLVGTVQFINCLLKIKTMLLEHNDKMKVIIPQAKPLSNGEILGCTSPRLDNKEIDCIIYIGDGRFHLESIMIHNPEIKAYKYDPYSKTISVEEYDFQRMVKTRRKNVDKCRLGAKFGIIFGTLGRQGSLKVLDSIKGLLDEHKKLYTTILISEITPDKIKNFGDEIDVFVQIACPRLSIDWGEYFHCPVITPYELNVALNEHAKDIDFGSDYYPMDFYSTESLGNWTPKHQMKKALVKSANK